MSLSITINNINDLTDAERAVLRLIVGDKQVTLTGPTTTRQFIESLAATPIEELTNLGPFAEPAADFDSISVLAEAERSGEVRSIRVSYNSGEVAYVSARVTKDASGKFVITPVLDIPSAPAVPIPASAELDSAGLPWDKRIHATTRSKLEDGTWRKLKGVDKTLVATVEAELRAVQAIPVPAQQVTYIGDGTGVHGLGAAVVPGLNADPNEIPPAGCYPEPVTSVPVPPAPTATLAEMQAKLNAVDSPVPVPPAPLTFADLMKHVTPMLVSGKLPQDTLLAVTAEFGLPHLAALGARPDLVEAVRTRIDEVVG